jgi:subtilisin
MWSLGRQKFKLNVGDIHVDREQNSIDQVGEESMSLRFKRAILSIAMLGLLGVAPVVAQAPDRVTPSAAAKVRVFVDADDSEHKGALIAIADRGLRHEYRSPGNELTFSAELTAGQIRAMERLGARIEAVPLAEPLTRGRRYGALREFVTPSARPVCGDNICQGNESQTCPIDCAAVPPPPSDRACEPQDQREYQTLLVSGDSAATDTGTGINLLIIDTGVNKDHPDLDVVFCRDATKPKIRNKCNDQLGHGTHTSGSAAANGGADGLGLLGAAPGVNLGVEKICDANFCWVDDMVRAIEDGVDNFGPDVISLSFSSPQVASLENAIQHAVDNGALFFASAGNSGPGPNTISYPASDPDVVAVGMLDAARIANRMSSRGIDDTVDTEVGAGEVEFAGGGLVIESTSMDGCYEIMSGTSMSTPSVAGFAAANWHTDADQTRLDLRNILAVDINNSVLLPGYDDTTSGFDTSAGYGLPRNGSGINGSIVAGVNAFQSTVTPGNAVDIYVTGLPNANYRIGVSSPGGDWTYGEFTTNGSGDSALTLTPWTDPGPWLLTVDFGGGATDFGTHFDTFEQTN